jgi:hypothetical protein
MLRSMLWVPLFVLSGCLIPDSLILKIIDRDEDGEFDDRYVGDLGIGTDCDDSDPAVGSDAPETCGDNTDNDCDGLVDEDSPEAPIWFLDHDRDGHGDAAHPKVACNKPPEHEPDATDCDDNQPQAHPGAQERCNGFDDDCDGDIDESGDPITWYADQDGDGHGDPAAARVSCARPSEHVQSATDCNDEADWIHPGATDARYDGVDADCAGGDDFDHDGDGARHPSAWAGAPPWDAVVDCDDDNNRIYPAAPELWYDGVDQDCDPSTEWDRDADGVTVTGAPEGSADDCDDTRADVGRPGAWYADGDGDGFGANQVPVFSCLPLPGHVRQPGDCNDNDGLISPVRNETCDQIDNNCNGVIDDGVGGLFWPDVDNDGYGDINGPALQACARPPGYSANGDDCDDSTNQRRPGFSEQCDYLDNDCDDLVDEGVLSTFYPDSDDDGFGDANGPSVTGCEPPDPSWTTDRTDCDDDEPEVSPAAEEECDGVDNDCVGGVDDGVDFLFYIDSDGDGVGRNPGANAVERACELRDGLSLITGDCDDTNPLIYGGANEEEFASRAAMIAANHDPDDWMCDGIDNDCDDGTPADPPGGCGAVARFDWGGSQYMLRNNSTFNATDAEEWCEERGYHPWHLRADDRTEHAEVMAAFNLPLGARVHLGARTWCPGMPTVRTCYPNGGLSVTCFVPAHRLYWYDPVEATCVPAWSDFPSLSLDYATTFDYRRSMHAIYSVPYYVDAAVQRHIEGAGIICELEVPWTGP